MPTIEVNGTTTYYECTGSGPAILFVHGMAGDADTWADQSTRFSDRYTCVRYDRRSHSRSTRGTAPISYETYADDAAALIDALGLAPCLVVSSSGGAAISVVLALRHPHTLRGLVVSEPPLVSLDPAAGDALLRELVPRVDGAVTRGGPEAGIDAFFQHVCPPFWSVVDDTRRAALRANAAIAFTDLKSLSIDLAS
jgi:pimeloyl-ACP methyl ester carboxylesterase